MSMLVHATIHPHSNVLFEIDPELLLDEIRASTALEDLVECRRAIDTIIARSLRKFVPGQTLYEHCLDSFVGGRRLKPLLVLLGIAIQDEMINDKALIGATAMEYFTSATVIIDDIIDGDTMRGQRGTPSIHAKYSVGEASLIASIMSKITVTILAEYFPEAVLYYMKLYGKIASAEYARSYKYTGSRLPSEARYFDLIIGINALAYRACFQLAALCCGRSKPFRRRFAKIGLPLGVAEQLGDDYLDLRTDFEQGLRTLPVLLLEDRYPDRELTLDWIDEVLASETKERTLHAEVGQYITDSIVDSRRRLELLFSDDTPLSPLQRSAKARLIEVIEHMKRKWEGNRMERAGQIAARNQK